MNALAIDLDFTNNRIDAIADFWYETLELTDVKQRILLHANVDEASKRRNVRNSAADLGALAQIRHSQDALFEQRSLVEVGTIVSQQLSTQRK